MSLAPVSFKKGRQSLPRLSKPYVPGKRHERFWSDEEKKAIRDYYPTGGASAVKAHLPHRTVSAINGKAHGMGVESLGKFGGPKKRLVIPADIDETIREKWPQLKGRGAVNRLAEELKVPRWWLSKRARGLGLAIPHKKEPIWTAAENELMKKVPLHDPDRAAAIFKEHGFNRTATAIVVHAKRIDLSRRDRTNFTGTSAAQLLGVDNKTTTTWCVKGELKATRRGSKRLPQQGGDSWVITRADLRQFILDNLERIDIRKVEKFSFVDLLNNTKDSK